MRYKIARISEPQTVYQKQSPLNRKVFKKKKSNIEKVALINISKIFLF